MAEMTNLALAGTIILGAAVGVGVTVGVVIWYAIAGVHSLYRWLSHS